MKQVQKRRASRKAPPFKRSAKGRRVLLGVLITGVCLCAAVVVLRLLRPSAPKSRLEVPPRPEDNRMKQYKETRSLPSRTAAEKPKRKPLRKTQILLMVLIAVFCISAAALGLRLRQEAKARNDFQALAAMVQSNTPEPTVRPGEAAASAAPAQTEPIGETAPELLPQYAPLYEQNPELFGWIRIEGTRINYPVMYSPGDPDKYLHTNFQGEYSYAGIPFVDGACAPDSDNLILYSHNMLDGSMFRSLLNYENSSFWQAHPTIKFDTLYEEQEFEVLAAFYDQVYNQDETCFKFYQFIDAADEADFDNAIAHYQEKQLYDTGVTASYGDKLITLVTCAYHVRDGRFVVVARKK